MSQPSPIRLKPSRRASAGVTRGKGVRGKSQPTSRPRLTSKSATASSSQCCPVAAASAKTAPATGSVSRPRTKTPHSNPQAPPTRRSRRAWGVWGMGCPARSSGGYQSVCSRCPREDPRLGEASRSRMAVTIGKRLIQVAVSQTVSKITSRLRQPGMTTLCQSSRTANESCTVPTPFAPIWGMRESHPTSSTVRRRPSGTPMTTATRP